MSYFNKLAIAFLKEMSLDTKQLLTEAEQLSSSIEQLYHKYCGFIETNPRIAATEPFKSLENDLKNLVQTCRFVSTDCRDVCYSIADCGVEINQTVE